MATLSIDQAAQYAAQAGFSGQALRTIVAIAQAESSLVTNARHTNSDGGTVDRGILQINNFWHGEVSDAQCDDPATAFRAGWRISSQGSDFSPWTTYNTGAYQQTAAWKQLADSGGGTPPPGGTILWSPAKSASTWPWMTADGVNLLPTPVNPWHSGFEAARGGTQDGIGLPMPLDTVITSLTLGTVMAAAFGQDLAPAGANWNFGGFIVVRSDLPIIGKADVFYRHMDSLSVKKGDIVAVGQELGLSGGQTTGGFHPESPVFSTGPHIDVGVNPSTLPYASLGANVDPTAWIVNLVRSGPPAKDQVGIVGGGGGPTPLTHTVAIADQVVGGYGPTADSFTSIEQHIDASMALVPFRTASGNLVTNPVANWPVIGGVVNFFQAPFNAAGSVEDWLSGVSDWIGNNTLPVLLRFLFVVAGLVIITAFIFNLLGSESFQVVPEKVPPAAQVATGAALAGV